MLLVRVEFLDHKSKGRVVGGQIVEGQIVVASRNEEGRFNLLGHKKGSLRPIINKKFV